MRDRLVEASTNCQPVRGLGMEELQTGQQGQSAVEGYCWQKSIFNRRQLADCDLYAVAAYFGAIEAAAGAGIGPPSYCRLPVVYDYRTAYVKQTAARLQEKPFARWSIKVALKGYLPPAASIYAIGVVVCCIHRFTVGASLHSPVRTEQEAEPPNGGSVTAAQRHSLSVVGGLRY